VHTRTLAKLLVSVQRTVRAAGDAILAISPTHPAATAKQDGSPLTAADLASHRIIESQLRVLRQSFPVISEEGDLEAIGGCETEIYWLVDPLDGTKEFVRGLDEYTVNVALVERGVPILGVIFAPAKGTLYYAARNRRAWKIEGDQPPKRISASSCEHPTTAVVSRSHVSRETVRFLSQLNVTRIVRRGSSLKMCEVAEGAADIYPRFGPTYLWDTAAGTAIATAAGCSVLNLNGDALSYDLGTGLKHNGFIVQPARCAIFTGANL
jgi:3'(2'), 5'-bisphosphate nucleotidase